MKLLCTNQPFPRCVLSLNCLNSLHLWGLSGEGSIKPQETTPMSRGTFSSLQNACAWHILFYEPFQIKPIFFPIAMLHHRLLSAVSSSDMSFSTSPPLGNLHLQSFFSGCFPEVIPFQYSLSVHQWVMRVILLHPWVQGVFKSSDWMSTSTLGFHFGLWSASPGCPHIMCLGSHHRMGSEHRNWIPFKRSLQKLCLRSQPAPSVIDVLWMAQTRASV